MKYTILLIDDDKFALEGMRSLLVNSGFSVEVAGSGEEAIERVSRDPSRYGVIVMDYRMTPLDGGATAREILGFSKELYILFHSADASQAAAIDAIHSGACAFIQKHLGPEHFLSVVKEWARKYEDTYLIAKPAPSLSENERLIRSFGMVGRSPALAAIGRKILRIQSSDPRSATVLILGETGVGKELVARAIHAASPRRNEKFVAINCAALPEQMLESELFGHERGAFTGAIQKKLGKFQFANKGTIFLDEMGELPLSIQAKLLRVLEHRVITPLGSNQEQSIDVRIIAATNIDPEKAIREKRFRQDLYFRIKSVVIEVPSLRERPEDIEPLVLQLVERYNEAKGTKKRFLLQTIRSFERYPWPGNVRQLEDEVLSLLTEVPEDVITKNHIDDKFDKSFCRDAEAVSPVEKQVAQVRLEAFKQAIATSRSHREAARKLSLPFSTFRDHLKRLGLSGRSGKRAQ